MNQPTTQPSEDTTEAQPTDAELADACFVEWRGSDDQHRVNDVVIRPQDVDTIRMLLISMFQTIDYHEPDPGPDPYEGKVLNINTGNSSFHAEGGGVDGQKILVCSEKGPKFVAKPEHEGVPYIIKRETYDDYYERINQLSEEISEVLYPLADWAKLEYEQKITIPANELPVFAKGSKLRRSGKDHYGFIQDLGIKLKELIQERAGHPLTYQIRSDPSNITRFRINFEGDNIVFKIND